MIHFEMCRTRSGFRKDAKRFLDLNPKNFNNNLLMPSAKYDNTLRDMSKNNVRYTTNITK